MPSLLAVISGNADPLKRELQAVQRMAEATGRSMRQSIDGGGHGGGAGILRETTVILRELSRGNYTRLPGSLSILMQRMGILNLLIRDSSTASKVLADAWEAQAAKAGMAALAATRKAQASAMAFEADLENTEATLAQAVADEEGAAAAIANAKATQAKAVASREAAAAAETTAVTGVGALGVVLGIVAAIAAGAYAAYKLTQNLVDTLAGLETTNFHPEYIAKHLKASNQALEGQKRINKEVERTIELYNSAAEAAARVSNETRNHFSHLRKMASFEKDPKKRAAREMEIDHQERQQILSDKVAESASLDAESKNKKAQADAIRVTSKEADRNDVEGKKKAAEEAQKYIDDLNAAQNGGDGSITRKLIRGYNSVALSGVSGDDLDAAERANREEAQKRIQAYHDSIDREAANDEIRKRKDQLTGDAAKAASESAKIQADLPRMMNDSAQADKDEADEKAAELKNERGKMYKGHVNGLQQVGAYTSQAVHIDIARHSLHKLTQIERNTAHGGKGNVGGSNGREF